MPRLPSVTERLVLAAQAVCPDLRLAGGGGLALLLDHRDPLAVGGRASKESFDGAELLEQASFLHGGRVSRSRGRAEGSSDDGVIHNGRGRRESQSSSIWSGRRSRLPSKTVRIHMSLPSVRYTMR